ncbi:hypothetical protein [Patiriisocius hiemis]|uniref:Uncharacterized protein n=1 Tax=Patiriisocius hiemis TaxID=3075604 RepID=A0ABU2YE18_9FLAO|nr:hypothetical protein [Constantimarinum sp. W242]MDT0556106.1 hypothetical protein [Constantimarinum sp. W242]
MNLTQIIPNKLLVLLVLFSIFSSTTIFAQVGINTTSPDNSSIIDITSTNKGMLIPRMTSAQRDAISNPANGLLIYNTDSDEFQFNSNNTSTPIWEAFDVAPVNSSNIGQSIKYSNLDITTNVNASPAINAPLLGTQEWNDNTTLYVPNFLTNEITISETGRYRIVVNIPLITADVRDRMAPEMRITVNGTPVASYSSTGYIRTNNGHQSSSLHLTEVLEVTNGDAIAVIVQQAGNASNATNTVEIREVGAANIYIEKIL